MSRHHFRFRVVVPKIDMEGQYEMNAKLLFLNLVGKGPITINVSKYTEEKLFFDNLNVFLYRIFLSTFNKAQ